jgi:hypothetical protein
MDSATATKTDIELARRDIKADLDCKVADIKATLKLHGWMLGLLFANNSAIISLLKGGMLAIVATIGNSGFSF